MSNKIIIDTSVLVGLYDKNDTWYHQAKTLMDKFKGSSLDLVILDCVVNETFTVLARRLEERKKHKVLVSTLTEVKSDLPKDKITKSYEFLETEYEKIIDRIIDSKGKINFHDSLIITFALSEGISFIASFDEDFDTVPGMTRIFDPVKIP